MNSKTNDVRKLLDIGYISSKTKSNITAFVEDMESNEWINSVNNEYTKMNYIQKCKDLLVNHFKSQSTFVKKISPRDIVILAHRLHYLFANGKGCASVSVLYKSSNFPFIDWFGEYKIT